MKAQKSALLDLSDTKNTPPDASASSGVLWNGICELLVEEFHKPKNIELNQIKMI